jgi:sec-independent protein translocase protein TatA
MHLIIILVIAIVIFGPKKLPELGKGLGKSIREFKKAMEGINKDVDVTPEVKETPKEITSPTTMKSTQEPAAKETVESKKENTV